MSSTAFFLCDSCKVSVDPAHPRIHCLICHDFDLCANCAIGEKLPYGHLAGHAVEIYKESGYPSDKSSVLPSQVTISYDHKFESSHPTNLNDIYVQRAPPPPIPLRPDFPPAPNVQQILLAQSGWEPFFLPDMTPTSTYTALANEIFTYLDPRNLGILVPETLSRFLDDMGYPPNENYWKNGSAASSDASMLSDRDKALKNIFEIFSIEHHLLPRPSATQSCLPMMPAITRKGFIDVTSIDLLTDPSRQWEYISGVLIKYNLPIHKRWGDLPRSVLPPVPEQSMVDKVANSCAKPRGREELSVETKLQIQLRMIELQSRLSSLHSTSRNYSNHLLMNSLNNNIRY